MSAPSQRARRRGVITAIVVGIVGALILPGSIAQAGNQVRIQQVETTTGKIQMLLSATGLPHGEYLDPATVKVSVAGTEVPAEGELYSRSDSDDGPGRSSVLAIDTSGSMAGGRLSSAKNAADQYLKTVPRDVSVGLVTFADDAKVVVKPTTNRARVSQAVSALKPAGATALYDGTAVSIDALGPEGARNVLLLSDGADEGSATSRRQALKLVADSGVVLDAVSLGNGVQVKELKELTQAGDGQFVAAKNANEVADAFESVARASSSQLAVSVELPDGSPSGTQAMTVSATAGDQTYSESVAVNIPAAPVAVNNGPKSAELVSVPFLLQPWVMAAVLAVLFVSLVAIAWMALQKATGNTPANELDRRLAAYSGGAASTQVQKQNLRDMDLTKQAVRMADEAIEGKQVKRSIRERLEAAAIPMNPAEWFLLNIGIALAAVVLGALLTGFNILWMLIFLVAGILIPWMVLGTKAAKRQKEFYEALPDTLQLIAGSLRAGYSFRQAVDSVARDSTGPISEELSRAINESRFGITLEDALDSVAHRMKSQDLTWTVMAVRINRKVGGNLAEVLGTVADTVRERERLRRQVQTLTAEGKMSAYVLLILPVGMFLFLVLFRPEYIQSMLTSPLGLAMLGLAAGLMIMGYLWMHRLVQMEV